MKYSLSVIDTELWYVGYAPELEFTKVYKNPSLFENLKNNSYSSAVFEWAIIQWTLFFQYLIYVFLVFLNFEPVHDIQNFLEPKDFSWGIMKVPYTKIFITCSRVPQIQYVGDSKYKLTFLKKDSQGFKNSIYLGFLWIRSKPGKQN